MKLLCTCVGLLFLFVNCNNDSAICEDLKDQIAKYEHRIHRSSEANQGLDSLLMQKSKLANVLQRYYTSCPNDPYAATCLSKLHMLYSGMNDTRKAVAYADTLIEKYPEFPDRSQVIESQIVSYELEIRPRNVEMIKTYLKLWLKENKAADKEKIQEMKYHLEHVNLSLEDRIKLNLKELSDCC